MSISKNEFLKNLKHVMLNVDEESCIPLYFREDSSDEDVLHQVFNRQYYDLTRFERYIDIHEKYQKIITSNRTPLIIDCGANIGASSIWFSKSFPKAKIFALEPEKNNYNILCMNCSNHAPDIICENAAISCIDETLYLQDPGLGHWGFRTNTELGLNGIPVRAVSVESVEKLFPESDLFIVKIDIEGGESRLFESNLKWVSRTMVIIIELHDRLFLRCANSQNCLKALSEHPRDIFFSGENILSIRND